MTISDRLRELREACEKAEPGPWRVAEDPGGTCEHCDERTSPEAAIIHGADGGCVAMIFQGHHDNADATFIAIARTSMPILLEIAECAAGMAKDAHPMWAPELRAWLAKLEVKE